jgi:hypothetical protein
MKERIGHNAKITTRYKTIIKELLKNKDGANHSYKVKKHPIYFLDKIEK